MCSSRSFASSNPCPRRSTHARATAEVVDDRLWYWLYLPLARGVEKLTSLITVLQRGRISVYLMYSFVTLLLLLLFVR